MMKADRRVRLKSRNLCQLSLREAMSHAQTGRRMLVGSLLTKEHLTGCLYTANAATASKKRSVCEPVGVAHRKKPGMAHCKKFMHRQISIEARRTRSKASLSA